MHDESREHFFRVEPAAWFEDAMNFGKGTAPLGHVMDDAEVKHRIVGRIWCADGSGVTNPEPGAGSTDRETRFRARDHPCIEVECVDGIGPEDAENQLGADSPPAADFQGPPTTHPAAHPQQSRRFKTPLYRGANRVVHQRVFGAIEKHRP
jgi:hypothetical protein